MDGDTDHFKRLIGLILRQIVNDMAMDFNTYQPDFQMPDLLVPRNEVLSQTQEPTLQADVNYVDIGNVHHIVTQSSYCPKCHTLLIQRSWHLKTIRNMEVNRCAHCNSRIPDRFEEANDARCRNNQRWDQLLRSNSLH